MKKTSSLFYPLFPTLILILAGCQPGGTIPASTAIEISAELTPYVTQSPGASPAPVDLATSTPLPTATATPRTHVIAKGEDLGGIAYQYGVTVPAIMEANPAIDPYLLAVGTTLVIPAATGKTENAGSPAPTAAPVQVEQPTCARSADGGAWCFLIITNPLETAVENVSVRIRLVGVDQQVEKTAVTPLNLIPAGGSLPAGVFFPAPLPDAFQAEVGLLTALPRATDDQRYLAVEVRDLIADIDEDGVSAVITGKVAPREGEAAASQIWVALAAYDSSGSIIGLRRWEGQGSFSEKTALDFSQRIYSTGGAIDRVQAWAEARP